MIDNTCKTCNWWTGDPVIKWDDYSNLDGEIDTGRRQCTCPKIVGLSINDGLALFNDIPADHAECIGTLEPYAEFATGPDFGCIHWEAKA